MSQADATRQLIVSIVKYGVEHPGFKVELETNDRKRFRKVRDSVNESLGRMGVPPLKIVRVPKHG